MTGFEGLLCLRWRILHSCMNRLKVDEGIPSRLSSGIASRWLSPWQERTWFLAITYHA